jgi:restriction endonuclease Mrr
MYGWHDDKDFRAEQIAKNIHQLSVSENSALLLLPEFRERVIAAFERIYGEDAELVIDVSETNRVRLLWFRPSDTLYKIPAEAEVETEAALVNLNEALIKGPVKYLYSLNPRQFEELIGEILYKNGYEVHFTKQTHDGGYDIIAYKKDKMGFQTPLIAQCKRYRDNRKVGVAVVRELHAVQTTMNIPYALLATTSSFSRESRRFAEEKIRWGFLHLADREVILQWISEFHIMHSDEINTLKCQEVPEKNPADSE